VPNDAVAAVGCDIKGLRPKHPRCVAYVGDSIQKS
jgi:hypothetical protein